MRYGPFTMIALISLLVILVPYSSSISLEMEDDPLKEASENDGPKIVIEDVELDLRNGSGSFSLDLGISGSAAALTDHVNISLALYNGTGNFSGCLWIEPMDISMLGMVGISLLGTGDDEGAWTEWEMIVNLSIPYYMELGSTLGLILPWLGIPADQIPLQNLSIADLMGAFGSSGEGIDYPGDIMDLGSIVLVARAYDGMGNWYQDDRDITLDIMIAALEFAISEGLIDSTAPVDDPDEEDSSDGGGKGDRTAEWVLLSAGAFLFTVSLVGSVIFLASRRK